MGEAHITSLCVGRVDGADSKSAAEMRGGSNPLIGTFPIGKPSFIWIFYELISLSLQNTGEWPKGRGIGLKNLSTIRETLYVNPDKFGET